MSPVTSRLSPDDKIGARLGAFSAWGAIGVFTGTPIAGSFLKNNKPGEYTNLIIYTGVCMTVSANQTFAAERKDTVRNAEATGVFCWQLATYPLREAVNITAEQTPYGVDEFERAGLEKVWSTCLKIPVPMVKDSPVRFECEYYTTLRLPGNPPMGTVDVVIGKVVGKYLHRPS
ncbi:hypothetical protein AUP68_17345 [Ilyonectria robusta]